ncbi:MAG: HD domain-containing protein [Candidatus Sungbacteria bacterium]|nr:HD domain-containing protein [Candidatus Sungbacteria bacterium]
MEFLEILKAFPPSRGERLQSITRYSMFEVFFYRFTLWHHELRVSFIVEDLAPVLRDVLPHCNAEKAQILALVHDDAEMITGDVQLGHKYQMTRDELEKIDDDEAAAIEKLSGQFPERIGGYRYKELLYHALRKDCIEAKVVSYADKLDAYCESLHEILGGNISALRSVIGYTEILHNFDKMFPELQSLLSYKYSPLMYYQDRTDHWKAHRENYVFLNKPHTRESIERKTEFPFYNRWKELVVTRMGEEGVKILIEQKERL